MCEHPRYIPNKQVTRLARYHSMRLYRNGEYVRRPDKEEINEDNCHQYEVVNLDTGVTYPAYIEIPCGHCLLCQNKRRKSIIRRIQYECQTSKTPVLYITLTYNNESLPEKVTKKDFRDFIRRVREYWYKTKGYRITFKYFAAYEHGKHRPHFHALLFDFPNIDYFQLEEYIRQRWNNGFVNVQVVGEKTARKKFTMSYKKCISYVTKYCLKESVNPSDDEFQMWSSGLGSAFIKSFGLIDNPYLRDIKYYDYIDEQYKPVIIDKVFLYYAFMKKDYVHYLKARQVLDNSDPRFADYFRDVVLHVPNHLRPHFSGHNTPAEIRYIGMHAQDFADAITIYAENSRKRDIFMSLNKPKIDPQVFKEVRNLELLSIKQLIATRQDKELL